MIGIDLLFNPRQEQFPEGLPENYLALFTLKIPLAKQFTGNHKWRQTLHETFRTGYRQKQLSGIKFVYLRPLKNSNLSPELLKGNIFTEV